MAKPRFYIRIAKNIHSDPKLQTLTEGERWAWICLLILADDSAVPGTLCETPDEMAYRLRLDPATVEGCIRKLMDVSRPPIIQDINGCYTIVNFKDHQGARFPSDEPEAVKGRVYKHREAQKQCNDCNDDVTIVTNETSGETVTTCNTTHDIPLQSNTSPPTPQGVGGGRNIYPKDFEAFWVSYPKKVGKGAAYATWRRIKDLPAIGPLIASVEAHTRSEQWQRENGRYIPNPATFLNQRRWEDEAPTAPKPTENQSWRFVVQAQIDERVRWIEKHPEHARIPEVRAKIAELEASL